MAAAKAAVAASHKPVAEIVWCKCIEVRTCVLPVSRSVSQRASAHVRLLSSVDTVYLSFYLLTYLLIHLSTYIAGWSCLAAPYSLHQVQIQSTRTLQQSLAKQERDLRWKGQVVFYKKT